MASKEREILEGKIDRLIDNCVTHRINDNYSYEIGQILSSVLDAIEKKRIVGDEPGITDYVEMNDIKELLGGNDG